MKLRPESFFWTIESYWKHFSQNEKTVPLEGEFFCLPFLKTPTLEHSSEVVFFDEHQRGYTGLKQCFWTYWKRKPVFVVDNHHKVLSVFAELSRYFQHPLQIVHIDAHRDDAIFPYEYNESIPELEKKCRVSDYLDVAQKLKIVDTIFSYTQSFEFEAFSVPNNNFILNLDIDIYGEEGSMIETKKKTEVITKAWYNARAICIATSPGFINQQNAFRIIDTFLSEL